MVFSTCGADISGNLHADISAATGCLKTPVNLPLTADIVFSRNNLPEPQSKGKIAVPAKFAGYKTADCVFRATCSVATVFPGYMSSRYLFSGWLFPG